jgi:hypothetical protein
MGHEPDHWISDIVDDVETFLDTCILDSNLAR